MEPLTLGLGAVFLMGLVFGAGPCNITCLPYLGPVFLARSGGVRGAWRTVLPFTAGRLAGYAALGAVAGAAGRVASDAMAGELASALLGSATIAVGLYLLLRSQQSACPRPATAAGVQPLRPAQAVLPTGLFGMGAALALNPCAPLGTVLLAAAATAEPWQGLGLGLAFGAGAAAVPALFFGLLIAHLGEQMRVHIGRWRSKLERGAGALLIVTGMMTALGWTQP